MPYALDSLGWNASRSGKGRIGSGFEMKTCVVIAACENTRDLMAASLEARGLDAALLVHWESCAASWRKFLRVEFCSSWPLRSRPQCR